MAARISDVKTVGTLHAGVQVLDGDELVRTFGNDRDARWFASGYSAAKIRYGDKLVEVTEILDEVLPRTKRLSRAVIDISQCSDLAGVRNRIAKLDAEIGPPQEEGT